MTVINLLILQEINIRVDNKYYQALAIKEKFLPPVEPKND